MSDIRGIALPLDLGHGTIPTDEGRNGTVSYNPNKGVLYLSTKTTGGAEYYSPLDYTAFDPAAVRSQIATYGYADPATSVTTAQFGGLHLAAGESLTISYKYVGANSSNQDDSFAMLGDSSGHWISIPLENSAQIQAYHYADNTTYTARFDVGTSGTYNLLLVNAHQGTNPHTAELQVQSISYTAPAAGLGAYTVAPDGILLADGTKLLPSGALALADGGSQPALFAAGSKLVVAHLIGQDGTGLIGQDGTGLIGQDGTGLIGNDGTGLIGNDSTSFVTKDGAALIGNDGTGLIGQDGTGLIGQDGTGLVSEDGAGLISERGAGLIGHAGGTLIGHAGGTLVELPRAYVFVPEGSATLPLPPPAPPQPTQTLAAPAPLGGDGRVGEDAPASPHQNDPAVAALPTGKFAVAWSDYNTVTGTYEVRAQLRAADGSAAGPSVVASASTGGDQYEAGVTGLAGGGYVVSWRGNGPNAEGKIGENVYFQRFDATGAAAGTLQTIGFGPDLAETGPRVASTWDGGFVLSFEAKEHGADGSAGVTLRFDANGTPLPGTPVGNLDSDKAEKSDIAVAGLSDGRYVAVYREVDPGAKDSDGIYLDVVGTDGTRSLADVHVNTTAAGAQKAPALARLTNDKVAVAWVDAGDSRAPGLAALHAQVVDPATGAKIGPEIHLGNTLAGGAAPSVTALSDGKFLVVWDAPSVQDGVVKGLHLSGQVFGGDGASESPVFAVGTPDATGATFEGAAAATQLADGAIVVAGRESHGATSSIQVNFLSATGQTAGLNRAPSGTDAVVVLEQGYQSAPPYDPVYRHTFAARDFGFSDPDGNALAGVVIDAIPPFGTLTLDHFPVTMGEFVAAGDLGRLVYASPDAGDHTLTFRVRDDGGTAYGGHDTDATAHTLTLHVDAPPVFHDIAAQVAYAPGRTIAVSPNVSVTDADDATLNRAFVAVSQGTLVPGDVLAADTSGTAIKATYYPTSGNLNLDGVDTLAHYRQVLQSVTYRYEGDPAAAGANEARTVYWKAIDVHGGQSPLTTDNATTITFGAPAAGGYAVAAAPNAVAEGTLGAGGAITYTVTRTDATSAATVDVALTGTASAPGAAGADYAVSGLVDGHLTFAAGATSARFTVTATPDALHEGDETVIATISNPSDHAAITTASATATILDDDLEPSLPPPTPAPTVAITGAVSGLLNGAAAAAGIAVKGTATGIPDGGVVTLTLVDADGAPLRVVHPKVTGGAWSVSVPGALLSLAPDGTYGLVVDASGADGQAAKEVKQTFVLDRLAPDLAVSAPGTVAATSSKGATVSFSARATDAHDGTDPVTFTEGGHAVRSGDVFAVGKHVLQAAATDQAGNAADPVTFAFTVTAAPAAHGRVIDGYVAGATVFADANANGRLDPGEATTTTDAQGDFTLVGGSGTLVATGGTDLSTGLPFRGMLAAPEGATVVTPLTTLAVALAAAGVADPVGAVRTALGLPAAFDLTHTDPLAAGAGDPGALAVARAGAAVADTIALVSAGLSGAGVSGEAAGAGALSALAAYVAGHGGADLTSPAVVATIAASTGLPAGAADTIGAVVALSNARIAGAADLGAVAALQGAAQGPAAAAIQAAGADPGRLAAVDADFAGGGHRADAPAPTPAPTAHAPAPAEASFAFAFASAHLSETGGRVVLTGSDGVAHDVTGIGHLHFADGTIDEADGAPLVDDLHYYAANPDVWAAHVRYGLDADQHYAQYGWREGRDPSALFSTSAYLAANPDVAASGANPLQHYAQVGWQEGRASGTAFSAGAYLAANPDVAAAGASPLQHYLQFGAAEGRAALPASVTAANGDHLYGDFDATYYLAHNSDVAAAARAMSPGDADGFAFLHYLRHGAAEGRAPDAMFDGRAYLAANPDVAAAGVNPLVHYEAYGSHEGRAPGFDDGAYLALHPEVAAQHVDPLAHYLAHAQG